jgi:SPP1 family predicted phage head-tail adaptor
MNCCSISASDFTERVTIEELTRTADGQGGWTGVWASIDASSTNIAAKVRPMSGAEARHAMRVAPRAAYTVHMYYRADANGAPFYTPAHRLLWRGRVYNILHTADVESASIYMYLLLNEGELS